MLATTLLLTISMGISLRNIAYTNGQLTPLYIGGYLSNSVWGFGVVDLCVRHVNEIQGILDDYDLRLRWNLTQRRIPGTTLHLLHEYVYQPPTVVGIVGPMFSTLCLEMNEVAASYGINQVTVATSPSLKDRSIYPLTVQSYQDNAQLTPAKAAFVKMMGWKRVAMLTENIDIFLQTSKELSLLLHDEGVSVIANEVITDVDDCSEQVKSLQRHDARIIFSEMYSPTRTKFMCQAYHLGLWGSKYIWIIPGYTQIAWWRQAGQLDGVPCTVEEMDTLMTASHLIGFVSALSVSPDLTTMDFNGVRPTEKHRQDISEIITRTLTGLYYDSCIALALALNASSYDLDNLDNPRTLDQFTYGDIEMGRVIHDHLVDVEFVGVTGHVSFSHEGVRLNKIAIKQLLPDTWLDIMTYDTASEEIKRQPGQSFQWINGFLPVDGITELIQPVHINRISRILLYTFTCFGILLTLIFFAINVIFRNKRAIKISSPNLNNFIVFGCLLLYVSVFILGEDTSTSSDEVVSTLCNVRLALLCVGFSLSFGALFMKTYRIHAIFQKAVKRFQRINVKDSKMMMGVLIPVLFDICIIAIMTIATKTEITHHRFEPRLDMSDPDAEIFIVPVVEFCTSVYQLYFTIVIYGVKAVLMTFGIFLAWETRNIQVSELNDSKYIAMSVYTVAVTLAIIVPSLNLTFYNIDLYFVLFSGALVFINTTVLCLVFLPKVLLLFKSKGKDIRITMMTDSNMTFETSSGIAIDKLGRKKVDQLRIICQDKQDRLKKLQAERNTYW